MRNTRDQQGPSALKMSVCRNTSNPIATIIKQATENCIKCGTSRKTTKSHKYYSSCENCSHLCCEPHKSKEGDSSRIVYESVWPHFLCATCHHTACNEGRGFHKKSFSPGMGICTSAFASNKMCDACTQIVPCLCKSKKSYMSDSGYKVSKPLDSHIHVTPSCDNCRHPKIQKTETKSSHFESNSSDHQKCICKRLGDPQDSGWIVHRE